MRWLGYVALGGVLMGCEASPDFVDGVGGANTAPGTGIGGKGGLAGAGAEPNVTFSDPIVVSSVRPPPISGGTLLVMAGDQTAVVSDPDHDQLLVVALETPAVSHAIALEAGDEPGRLAEDGAARVHVVLRRGGAVVTIDPASGEILERRAVCKYPRGIAYDAALDVLQVACAEGTLVTLPAGGGAATRSVTLARDLRDVVIENGRLWVSVFRSAEVLLVDEDGVIVERQQAPRLKNFDEQMFAPHVAWRLFASPGGGVTMIHQRSSEGEIIIEPGGYGMGASCGGIVESAFTSFAPGVPPATTTSGMGAPLPVDGLVDEEGSLILAIAGAAQTGQLNMGIPSVGRIPSGAYTRSTVAESSGTCAFVEPVFSGVTNTGQAVALAATAEELVVQTREPSMLIVGNRAVVLPGDSRLDTGHQLFHTATMVGLACASCHPEGREDGHTWNFAGFGPRRSQSVGGMLAGTEPFHWGGDEADFAALVQDVMVGRMAGPFLQDEHAGVLKSYIDSIPAWQTPVPEDTAAVDRGKAIFEREDVACATCHTGPMLTNNMSFDVGTGGALQVPSLRGLVWRAPFMHDGCAQTVADRFSCGGDLHGDTSALSKNELSDLVSYLESL